MRFVADADFFFTMDWPANMLAHGPYSRLDRQGLTHEAHEFTPGTNRLPRAGAATRLALSSAFPRSVPATHRATPPTISVAQTRCRGSATATERRRRNQ